MLSRGDVLTNHQWRHLGFDLDCEERLPFKICFLRTGGGPEAMPDPLPQAEARLNRSERLYHRSV